MKTNKVVASSLFAALFMTTSVSADTAVTEPETAVAVEEETPAEDTGTNCCCSPFGGFYFGLGLGWNIMKLKGEIKGAKDAEVTLNDAKFKFNEEYNDSASKNANRFVGTLMLGGGKLWDNGFYVGANFYFDLGQNKKVMKDLKKTKIDYNTSNQGDVVPAVALKSGAWSPALALRLGFVPASYNTAMVYLDLGAAYNKAKFAYGLHEEDESDAFKINGKELVSGWKSASKVTPLVRLGVQKAIGSKFIAGLEVEYKFKGTKTWGDYKSKKENDTTKKTGSKAKFKFSEGFTVRLIGTCNFKF